MWIYHVAEHWCFFRTPIYPSIKCWLCNRVITNIGAFLVLSNNHIRSLGILDLMEIKNIYTYEAATVSPGQEQYNPYKLLRSLM